LKFEKDHLCLACAMGKSTKKTHKPKSKDTNQEKLYLLHMDLCGLMRVKSVNRKKYILVIVDDYSRFTWVKFLRSKDETLDFIIKFLKMIQAVAIACFTQNRFIIRLRHRKTPYELLHSKLPDLSFFYVFGALCYLANNSKNLGKLQPKADIGIFIGYAPSKKAFRIYNRRTRRIVETLHVDFDELTAMASEQRSSGPTLNEMTPGTISSGLVQSSSPSTSYVPTSRNDSDLLFQPMFEELLNPPPSVVNQAPKVIAPIAEVIPPVYADSTGPPSSITVDQDAPSSSKTHTTTEIQSSVIPQDVGDDNLDMEVAHMGNDPLFGVPIPEVTSAQSSSTASPQSIVQTNHPMPHHNSKWTKDHPLNNIISQLSRLVSTRSLRTDLDSSIGIDLDSSLRTDLDSSIGTDLDSSLRTDLDSSIGTDLDSSLRTDLDSSFGTDLVSSLRTDLDQFRWNRSSQFFENRSRRLFRNRSSQLSSSQSSMALRTMATTIEQQVALDKALVPSKKG
nr:hypothetical protein [Tanacetum cinerariifolium]